MSSKVEEIKVRLDQSEILSRGKIAGKPLQIHEDIRFLLSEYDRLTAEVQEMSDLIGDVKAFIEGAMATLHANTQLWELGKDLLTRPEKEEK